MLRILIATIYSYLSDVTRFAEQPTEKTDLAMTLGDELRVQTERCPDPLAPFRDLGCLRECLGRVRDRKHVGPRTINFGGGELWGGKQVYVAMEVNQVANPWVFR